MSHIKQTLIVLALTFTLAACGGIDAPFAAPTPTHISPTNTLFYNPDLRRNPLDTEPCAPPCWQNIVPDVSTLEDVERIRRDELDTSGECLTDIGTDLGLVLCPGADIWLDADSIVDHIQLSPSETITMGQIIDHYGEPDTASFCIDLNDPHGPSYLIAVLSYMDMHFYFAEMDLHEDRLEPGLVLRLMNYGLTRFTDGSWFIQCYKQTVWYGFVDYTEIE
jgi:hypothetical protein